MDKKYKSKEMKVLTILFRLLKEYRICRILGRDKTMYFVNYIMYAQNFHYKLLYSDSFVRSIIIENNIKKVFKTIELLPFVISWYEISSILFSDHIKSKRLMRYHTTTIGLMKDMAKNAKKDEEQNGSFNVLFDKVKKCAETHRQFL